MSKTQLTKNIEHALKSYKPAKLDSFELNYRRGQYMSFEVPVTHCHIEEGIVDCVWLAEGYNNHRNITYCKAPQLLQYSKGINRRWDADVCGMNEQTLREIPHDTFIPCNKECVYKREMKSKDECVSIICFEIKISKADFHSKNGHNFIGNLNYYVMPYSLFKEVKDEIPDGIGCITYHSSNDDDPGKLRHAKESEYRILPDLSLYCSLLHTFLDKKNKQLMKLYRDGRDQLFQMEQRASSVVYELVKEMRSIPPDCYKEYFGHCGNCTEVDIRCDTCVWGDVFPRKYIKKLGWENKPYDNSIL